MLTVLNNFISKFYKMLLLVIIFFFFIIFFHTLYPTLSISKYIVKQNTEYFIFGNNNNKIKNLYYDFIIQRFYRNNFAKDENEIKNISKISKEFLVSTSEPPLYGYNLKHTYYEGSLGQVIILGHAACDGINGVLGVRLSKNYNSVELYSLFDKQDNTSPHTLIKLKNQNNDFFIDIYPANKVHFFSFQKKVNIGNETYKSNYTEFNKTLFDNGFTIKKFDLFSYFLSLLKKILPINTFVFSNTHKIIESKNTIVNVNLNETNKKYLANKFIDARFEHILGNKIKANELYDDIIKTNCKFNFCQIANIIKMKNNFL